MFYRLNFQFLIITVPFLFCGCEEPKLVTKQYLVERISKDKFNEDYITFCNTDYWMKYGGRGNKKQIFPYHVGDKLVITHKEHRNDSTVKMERLK